MRARQKMSSLENAVLLASRKCDIVTSTFVYLLLFSKANAHRGPYFNDLKRKYQSETQVTLWVGLRRCCYYNGGINDSCAWRKSKMGWSEVAALLIGVVCA